MKKETDFVATPTYNVTPENKRSQNTKDNAESEMDFSLSKISSQVSL